MAGVELQPAPVPPAAPEAKDTSQALPEALDAGVPPELNPAAVVEAAPAQAPAATSAEVVTATEIIPPTTTESATSVLPAQNPAQPNESVPAVEEPKVEGGKAEEEAKVEETAGASEGNKEVTSEEKKEEGAIEKVEEAKEAGEGKDEKPKVTKIGSTKFIWPGETVGEEVELGTVKAYHSAPPTSEDASEVTSVILVIHDGLGWTLKNCRLICDSLAASTGCHVYMPDLFGGESLGLTEAQMSSLLDDQVNLLGRVAHALRIGIAFPKVSAFMKKHGPEKTQPLLDVAVEEITAKHGGEKCKLGAVGYSWGAKYALRLGAQHKVAAAVACTPVSAVNPKDDKLSENKAPTLVVLAGKTRVFPDKLWKEVEGMLKESGAPLETLVCPGTKHGFANRCTESAPAACKGKDEAFAKTVAWFSQYLK